MPRTVSLVGAHFVAVVLDHVPRADESLVAAYERLRRDNPDAFPVPRRDQSFVDAMREAIARCQES